MRNLGALYQNGIGVKQDYTQARHWFEKAAAAGDAVAMRTLGVLYEKGQSWNWTTPRRGSGMRKRQLPVIPNP